MSKQIENPISKIKIRELLESEDFYILLTPFNIDILNKLLPKGCEVVYEKGEFWLRLKRKNELTMKDRIELRITRKGVEIPIWLLLLLLIIILIIMLKWKNGLWGTD